MVTRIFNLLKNNWIVLLAVVMLGVGVLFIDTAPVVFSLLPKESCHGQVKRSEEYQGHFSDGLTNIYYYAYNDSNNRPHDGISWAPTPDSKHGLFWQPFPVMSKGKVVDVECLKWFPQYSRIKGMRTRNIAMDFALFELVLLVFAVAANSKKMRNSRLFFNKNS